MVGDLAGSGAVHGMHFNFQRNCCPQWEILASSDPVDSAVTVTYSLLDDLFDCMCGLDETLSLAGIPAGSWTLELPGGVNREFVIE